MEIARHGVLIDCLDASWPGLIALGGGTTGGDDVAGTRCAHTHTRTNTPNYNNSSTRAYNLIILNMSIATLYERRFVYIIITCTQQQQEYVC